MKFGKAPIVRVAKRLCEAAGYLELGMTKQAMASLEDIDEPGPFAAAVAILRGDAARMERRFEDAAKSYETAARILPAPNSKPLWLALSRYHRWVGNTDRAIETLAHARGALPFDL